MAGEYSDGGRRHGRHLSVAGGRHHVISGEQNADLAHRHAHLYGSAFLEELCK